MDFIDLKQIIYSIIAGIIIIGAQYVLSLFRKYGLKKTIPPVFFVIVAIAGWGLSSLTFESFMFVSSEILFNTQSVLEEFESNPQTMGFVIGVSLSFPFVGLATSYIAYTEVRNFRSQIE